MDIQDAPEFTTTCDLRWSDFDRLGHLNQAVYHVLIEVARTEWLARVRVDDNWDSQAFVLARVELDYRREIDATNTSAEVSCRVVRIGTSSVTVEQQVRHRDGIVAASGRCVMVGWNAQERAKRVFGEEERAAFLR